MYIPTATLLYSTTYYKILTEKSEYIIPRILAFVPRHYVFKRVGAIFKDNVDFKIHSTRWQNKAKKMHFFLGTLRIRISFCLEILSRVAPFLKINLISLRNRLWLYYLVMYGEETQKAAFWRCPSSRSVVASAIRFISDLAEDNFKICPLSLRQRCSPYSNTVLCCFWLEKTREIKCKSISQKKIVFWIRYIFHIIFILLLLL